MGVIERVRKPATSVRRPVVQISEELAGTRLWPPMNPQAGVRRSGHPARSVLRTVTIDVPGIMSLTADDDQLLLIVPTAPVRVLCEGASSPVDVSGAALIARPGQVGIYHSGPTSIVLASIRRSRWQALVASRFEAPLRLRRALTVIGRGDAGLEAILDLAAAHNAPLEDAAQDALYTALIEILDGAGPASEVWELVAPLKRATDFILSNPGGASSWEVVADHAGMTTKTLQRQAQTYLGMTLSAFIRDVRLTAAHHSLRSACDSRSIARIASDYGFASGASFTRSYIQRYGETPTQTRVMAVRARG